MEYKDYGPLLDTRDCHCPTETEEARLMRGVENYADAEWEACPMCSGIGEWNGSLCPQCKGEGEIPKQEQIHQPEAEERD